MTNVIVNEEKISELKFAYEVLELFHDMDCREDIDWTFYGTEIKFHIDCSDLFHYRQLDSEELNKHNIHLLHEAMTEMNKITYKTENQFDANVLRFSIPMLFCAKSKKMRPLKKYYPKNNEAQLLFDKCGPERTNDDTKLPENENIKEKVAEAKQIIDQKTNKNISNAVSDLMVRIFRW